MVDADYRPNLEIDHDAQDRPRLRDTSTDPDFEILVQDIGSGGSETIFASGHTKWIDGTTDQEHHRFTLDAGESLDVSSIEFREKGGGSSTVDSFVELIDESDGDAVVASTDLNTKTSGGTSTEGATLYVQVTQDRGTDADASITIKGVEN